MRATIPHTLLWSFDCKEEMRRVVDSLTWDTWLAGCINLTALRDYDLLGFQIPG